MNMKLGKMFSKKFIMSFVCVLFTAIISLCGANLLNAYALDTTSGYQDTVQDDDNENNGETGGGDNGSGEEENNGNDEDDDITASISGNWSEYATRPSSGSGTRYSPFRVDTPEELAYIINSPGSYYEIDADIDMSAHCWNFSGIFTGSISGGTGNEVASISGLYGGTYILGAYIPISSFLVQTENATISNLIIEYYSVFGANFLTLTSGGNIIGTANNTTIQNCALVNSSASVSGGIVSTSNNSTIRRCMNLANLTSSSEEGVGGIVGLSSGTTTIEDCINYGSVTGSSGDVGGIVGKHTNGSLYVRRCINYGSIKTENSSKSIGGFVGSIPSGSGGEVNSCINVVSEAYISSPNYDDKGGLMIGYIGIDYSMSNTISAYVSDNTVYHYYNGFFGLGAVNISGGENYVRQSNKLDRGIIIGYMSDYNYSYSSNLSSTWTTNSSINTDYDNYDSGMVTLSYFVASVQIGLQNETSTSNGYEYQYSYRSGGYYVSIIEDTNGNRNNITSSGTASHLNTYYYTKSSNIDLFEVLGGNRKDNYIYYGVYLGDSEDAELVSTETLFTTNLCSNYNTVFVVRCGLDTRNYTFTHNYYNGFVEQENDNSAEIKTGIEGGYISSYSLSSGVRGTNNSPQNSYTINNVSSDTNLTITLTLEDGYELYGLFAYDEVDHATNISSLKNTKMDDKMKEIFDGDCSGTGNTATYQINLSELSSPLYDTEFVFLFVRYQYSIDLFIDNITYYSDSQMTTNDDLNTNLIYGYSSRVYGDDRTESLGYVSGSNQVTIAVDGTPTTGFLNGLYSWYTAYIDGAESGVGGQSFYWGGEYVFGFADNDGNLIGSGETQPKGRDGNPIISCEAPVFGDSSKDCLILDINNLFGTININGSSQLHITQDNSINITIKKFAVDVDETNPIGGKYVTYSIYTVDTFDNSVNDTNNYVFGNDAGTISVTGENGNSSNSYGIGYYFYTISSVYLTVVDNNGTLNVTEVDEGTSGAISAYKIDFTIFLFYNFVPNSDDILNSGWGEILTPKEDEDADAGGNIYLSDIVEKIEKNAKVGYYANGNSYSFVNASAEDYSFAKNESVESINAKLTEYQAGAENAETIWQMSGESAEDKDIFLLSYYSLATINLAFKTNIINNNNPTITISFSNFKIIINGDADKFSGSDTNSVTIKSYSKIEINAMPFAVHTFGYFYSFEKMLLDGTSLSTLPNYSFQLIASENGQKIDLTFEYNEFADLSNEVEVGYQQYTPERVGNVYLISKPIDLYWIFYNTISTGYNGFDGVRFRQTCDIDMSGYDFMPIGCEQIPFKGDYDGQYYSIYNLNIQAENLSNIGLFGYTEGAIIKNLNLINGSVTGFNNVGGIVGYAEESTFTRVSNYSCTVLYNSTEIARNHIFILHNDEVSSEEKISTYGEFNSENPDKLYDALLMLVKNNDNNNFDFIVNDVNNIDSIEGYEIADTTNGVYAYNIAGFAGVINGGEISISSTRAEVNATNNDSETSYEEEITKTDSFENVAGFVGNLMTPNAVHNCYTTMDTFAGNIVDNTNLNHCHTEVEVGDDINCDKCDDMFIW